MAQMKNRRTFVLFFGVIIGLVIALELLWVYARLTAIPNEALARVKLGMTEPEVVQLLGPPRKKMDGPVAFSVGSPPAKAQLVWTGESGDIHVCFNSADG